MILCAHCHQWPITGNQKLYCGVDCYREAKRIRERTRKTPPKPEARIRTCMRCERSFMSQHRFNRLCSRCCDAIERFVPLNGM